MQDRGVDHAVADCDLVMRRVDVVMGLDEARGTVDASRDAEAAELDHLMPLEVLCVGQALEPWPQMAVPVGRELFNPRVKCHHGDTIAVA